MHLTFQFIETGYEYSILLNVNMEGKNATETTKPSYEFHN